ncbi:MAG: hypothetical protein IPG59_17630 [Candidatus Melainabacteria bacterium]|nr:MAG: hypothetical protein IPG59_17630 [Candidatus Melainabacteria bacterium]
MNSKKQSSRFWIKILGVFAIFVAYNSFHSMTIYVGLTEVRECFSHYYRMTREPNPWEKFWGEKALDSWKFPWANQKDLAVGLVKGRTLIGLNKKKLLEKMGAPPTSQEEWKNWFLILPTSSSEEVCKLRIVLDEDDVVVDSYIDPNS